MRTLKAQASACRVFLPREEAVAQTAKDLVGAWVFVSSTLERDGKKSDYWGSNPPSIGSGTVYSVLKRAK